MSKIYQVGEVVPEFVGHPEVPLFDIDDSGARLIVFFNDPSEKEIEQFKGNRSFEIRFVEIRGIIFMLFKVGILNWMDAPYTPHLSPNLTKIQIPNEGEGLSLLVIFVNGRTGEIKSMRLLGLSEKFSRKLLGAVMELKMKPFDLRRHNATVNSVYSSYSTNQLLRLSTDSCRF